jgi:AcrR family transcriptional regulator
VSTPRNEKPGRRPGRRPGSSGAREQILAAARHSFGTVGYAASTVRGIARAADVDPALVHHYFGTKEELFAAALDFPVDPKPLIAQVVDAGLDGLGERIARTFLGVWDGTPGQGPMLALLRSAVSDPTAAQSARDFVTGVVLEPLARAVGPHETATLRASLVASQLLGVAMARYVVRVEPLASAPADVLAPRLGAVLDLHLSGLPTGP